VPEPSAFEVEKAMEDLKRIKSPVADQIPAELIKLWDKTNRSVIFKVISSIWKRKELSEEWKESIIVPIYKKDDKTDCNNCRGVSFLRTKYSILSNILL